MLLRKPLIGARNLGITLHKYALAGFPSGNVSGYKPRQKYPATQRAATMLRERLKACLENSIIGATDHRNGCPDINGETSTKLLLRATINFCKQNRDGGAARIHKSCPHALQCMQEIAQRDATAPTKSIFRKRNILLQTTWAVQERCLIT